MFSFCSGKSGEGVRVLSFEEINDWSGLHHFNNGYLQAVHSIDWETLRQSTMSWQNRLLLRFDSRATGLFGSHRVLSILRDLSKNLEFSNVAERRPSFVLVRSDVGEGVAEALCAALESQCTIIRLVDLPTDELLMQKKIVSRYQEALKINRAVLILPFDDYGNYGQVEYGGTLLDHPHWEAFALMVAHFIAKNSLQSLVIHWFLSAQYLDVGDDVALISCELTDEGLRCLKPVLIHAIQYTSGSFLEAGHSSRLYYGLLWHHNSMYQPFEVDKFSSSEFWGCLTCEDSGSSLHIQPMVAYLHVHERPAIDFVNFWHHLLEKRMPPSLTEVNLLVSMPGSGQSYVRFILELMTRRPTQGVETYFTNKGRTLGECFPDMDVNLAAEPILWVAHSFFEARKSLGGRFRRFD